MFNDGEDEIASHYEGTTCENVKRSFFRSIRVPRVGDNDEECEDIWEDGEELTHRTFEA